jgi:hypothetical protein
MNKELNGNKGYTERRKPDIVAALGLINALPEAERKNLLTDAYHDSEDKRQRAIAQMDQLLRSSHKDIIRLVREYFGASYIEHEVPPGQDTRIVAMLALNYIRVQGFGPRIKQIPLPPKD